MYTLTRVSLAILVLTTSTSTSSALSPPMNSEGLILTPHGWRPRECVHGITDPDHVIKPGHGGTWVHFTRTGVKQFYPELPQCVANAAALKVEWQEKTKSVQKSNASASATLPDEGRVLIGSESTPVMAEFSSTYYLPSTDPVAKDGQMLYFYLAMQDMSDNNLTVLQPVVAYCPSGCGEPYKVGWSGAAWGCCPSGQSWYGAVVGPISKSGYVLGTTVKGLDPGQSQVTLIWHNEQSWLTWDYDYRQYNWVGVVMEAHNFKSCDDFNSDPFAITDMSLMSVDNEEIFPKWKTTNNLASCGGSIHYTRLDSNAYLTGTS